MVVESAELDVDDKGLREPKEAPVGTARMLGILGSQGLKTGGISSHCRL